VFGLNQRKMSLKKQKRNPLAPIGGKILPFFSGDLEGKRENENPKKPEHFAPKTESDLYYLTIQFSMSNKNPIVDYFFNEC
jgi:hypothetical protein